MRITYFLLISFFCWSSSTIGQNDYQFRSRLSFSMDPAYAPFYHGVASGDPTSDAVIIWTRITPLGPVDSILVGWQVAIDTLFQQVVQTGEIWTNDTRDYTVKIDVTGLDENTWYYYRFSGLGACSMIGRTRTFSSGACDSLRFAVVSGSNYNNGYFNAYRLMANRNDYDGVIHLGDYIYEYETHHYGNHPDRELAPNWECLTLSDYRMRYAHYRLDPDLRFAHQQYPWIVIYDDHETANNSWFGGAENHQSGEGDWTLRKMAGIQAFKEWIPLREINDPAHPENHIHRTIPLGNLANLIMLDTRLEARDDPGALGNTDPAKTMLGTAQYNWLTSELYRSQLTEPVKWKILGNQVMFAPLVAFGIVLNNDQWDGYQFERQKILNIIYGWDIKNTVIITGDIHTSWASDVPNQSMGPYGSNGQGSGTVEFVTPSITSPSVDFGSSIGGPVIQSFNPHIKFVDLEKRGYFILDINMNRCQADWYFTNDINNYGGAFEYLAAAWYVNDNERFIRQATIPSLRLTPNPPFAPQLPTCVKSPDIKTGSFAILSVNPNPFETYLAVQLYSRIPGKLTMQLLTTKGKLVKEMDYYSGLYDLDYIQMQTGEISPGMYIVKITDSKGYTEKRQMIKQ